MSRFAWADADELDITATSVTSNFDFDPHEPRDVEGKWTATPGAGAIEKLIKKTGRIDVGGTFTDITNPDYEPKPEVVDAVKARVGKPVKLTVDIGAEHTTDAKILNTGTAPNGMKGIRYTDGKSEHFLPWAMLRAVDDSSVDVDEAHAAAEARKVPRTPYSAQFTELAKNAVTRDDALDAAPSPPESEQYLPLHWALGAYQAEGYAPINRALRTGDFSGTVEQNHGSDLGIEETSVKENIDAIDKLMKMSQLKRDVIVYRGVRHLTSIGADPLDNLEGLEFREPAYLSTSTVESRAASFIDERLGDTGAVLRIFAPKGTHGVSLGADESEILFDRGLRYRVIADNGFQHGARQLDVEVALK